MTVRSADLLIDAFGRIREKVHTVADGLTPDQLAYRLDSDANSIAWLLWHLTRVQDDHICEIAGTEQVWTAAGWMERFDLPFPPGATGFGHSSDDVAAVKVPTGELLTGYQDAVHAMTVGYVDGVTDPDLDRVVDERWTPPTTLGVRLVSVVNDGSQHVGQAAFIRGILERMR